MDHVAGPLYILLTKKVGVSNSINYIELLGGVCLSSNLLWNMEPLQFILKYVMLEKNTLFKNLCQAHLLEVGRRKILRDHETYPQSAM